MTALGGAVGSADAGRLASEFLDEQRIYGSDRRSALSLGEATFAVSPFRGDPAITSAGKRWMLVADIRLDNRDELRARVAGHHAMSDAELLLAGWLKAGEASLSWIAGDFAVAILDADSGLLMLARDPTGQAPLFYAHGSGVSAFASMPTGLKPFVGQLRLDKDRLAFTACNVGEADARSHFEQIRRVLPGEVVRLSRSRESSNFYWNPATAAETGRSTADLVEEYRHVLDQAVADRLKHCSRPIATHLSSGYDSSAVTATAARLLQSPDQLVAFTSAPSAASPIPESLRRASDESPIAAETAARSGARHIIVRDGPPLAEVLRTQSKFIQHPITSAPNLVWWTEIRKQAAALGANCLLTAELGNITLNVGGLYVLAEWLRRGRFLTWLREARLAAARPDTRWRGVLYLSFESWFPQVVSDELWRRYLGVRPMPEISFLRPEWTRRATEPAGRSVVGLSHAQRIRMLRMGEPGIFRKGALADDGVDERDPMSDRRLIEFGLRLPPEALYWRGVPRPVARAALADRLPPSVINPKKRGLQAADWAVRFTRDDANSMLEEVSASTTAQELLDLKRMRGAIERWPTQDWNELGVYAEYRIALISALAVGMFSLVHEER
ncbi:MAG: asparagine synthase-related protein [Sphingomonas sp.]